MKRATFEELCSDPFCGLIIKKIEEWYKGIIPEDIKKFIIDSAAVSESQVNEKVTLLQHAYGLSKKITDGVANSAEYVLFWIKLWSIVHEYSPQIHSSKNIYDKLASHKKIPILVDKLLATFSKDDIVLIDFLRHHHVHLHVDSLIHHPVRSKNKVKIKPPRIPDAIEIAESYFDKCNNNQRQLAVDFASRIILILKELYDIEKANRDM
jgi:hypothetical protein